jgi:hypothetical protein
VALAVSGLTRTAWADGIIRIKNPTGFAGAITDGRIRGLDPAGADPRSIVNTSTLRKAYGAAAVPGFRPTAVATNTTSVRGLIGATGTAADRGSRIIGAWSYRYIIDPDVSGIFFDIELFLPEVGSPGLPGIDTLSIALIDDTGLARIWQWDDTALTAGFQSFRYFLRDGLGAGGSTALIEDPAFDLTIVREIQVSYRGLLTGSFPSTPPADQSPSPYGDTALWIGATRLNAVPEPGGVVIFALGAALLGVWAIALAPAPCRKKRHDSQFTRGRA